METRKGFAQKYEVAQQGKHQLELVFKSQLKPEYFAPVLPGAVVQEVHFHKKTNHLPQGASARKEKLRKLNAKKQNETTAEKAVQECIGQVSSRYFDYYCP